MRADVPIIGRRLRLCGTADRPHAAVDRWRESIDGTAENLDGMDCRGRKFRFRDLVWHRFRGDAVHIRSYGGVGRLVVCGCCDVPACRRHRGARRDFRAWARSDRSGGWSGADSAFAVEIRVRRSGRHAHGYIVAG